MVRTGKWIYVQVGGVLYFWVFFFLADTGTLLKCTAAQCGVGGDLCRKCDYALIPFPTHNMEKSQKLRT